MKIISFIEEETVIRKILRRFEVPDGGKHCGLWKDPPIRPPPQEKPPPVPEIECPTLDYGFFESAVC